MNDSRILSAPMLGLIWFGAAVSLAEILTGTFFAPLGLERGIAAIIVGHAVGGALFFAVSYVSAASGKTAMGVARRSFGRVGSSFFAGANALQLVGWTAIMVFSGAVAAEVLVPALGMAGWAVVIGALIVMWIAVGVRFMSKVQSAAAVLLFLLTIVAGIVVFGVEEPASAVTGEGLSFGAAVELAAAMPLSWLPVAGDYTRQAKRALAGSLSATIAYTIGSCWMFAMGLGCALYAGSDDLAGVLAAAGLGVAGLLIVVLSTVTTTFLDAQSAGQSLEAIHPRLNARICGIVVAVAGTMLACVAPVGDFEGFLYLIGSVFAPLATIVCVNHFALKQDAGDRAVDWPNLALWLAGFVLYRFSLAWDLPCGNTLPVMLALALATYLVARLRT